MLRRWGIWVYRHVRATHVLEALSLLIAFGFGLLFWPATTLAGALAVAYIVVVLLRLYVQTSEVGGREHLQAGVIWRVLAALNAEVFASSNNTRFTLFRPDDFDPEFIVPRYRFRRGGRDALKDAEASRARYRRGEGATGIAWDKAGKTAIHFAAFPVFESRQAMAAYYVSNLDLPPERIENISDYMVGVRAIISVAFTDYQEKFLGVLSIDLRMPTEGKEDKFILEDEGKQLVVEGGDLYLMAETFRTVIEMFYSGR